MVFKQGDIVVLVAKQKKVGTWTFGHKPGTVGRIASVNSERNAPYHVWFLSDYVGCASVFYENELKLAPAKVRKKYSEEYIKKMFGECFEKGCNDDCPHHMGTWKRPRSSKSKS